MARFRSVPHEVTATQWHGEVTPLLRELFGDRPLTHGRCGADGESMLGVPQEGETVFAAPTDWVVRTDFEGGEFDLDVMENDDFNEMYVLASQALGVSIGIPVVLMNPAGVEATTELRLKVDATPDPGVVAAIVAQLLPYIGQGQVVGLVQAVCATADPDTLVTVRDAVERIMLTRTRHH